MNIGHSSKLPYDKTYYPDHLDESVAPGDYRLQVYSIYSPDSCFAPIGINNPLGQLTISAKPSTSIISSTYNRIITIDPFDPSAITVTVIPKTNS